MRKQQPSGADRIVTCSLGNDKRQVRLPKNRHLSRKVQDSAVRRDEAVPRLLVVVQREEHLPVLHLCSEKRVDAAERNEVGFGDEAIERADDRLGEILVER